MVEKEVMRDIAKDIISNIKSMIRKMDITYTGQLENSFKASEVGDDIIIGSNLVYAPIVEYGRIPGSMPPVNVLFPWVVQKIGARDEEHAKRIAFAVAKKIEKEGIEPKKYIRATLHKMQVESQ